MIKCGHKKDADGRTSGADREAYEVEHGRSDFLRCLVGQKSRGKKGLLRLFPERSRGRVESTIISQKRNDKRHAEQTASWPVNNAAK